MNHFKHTGNLEDLAQDGEQRTNLKISALIIFVKNVK